MKSRVISVGYQRFGDVSGKFLFLRNNSDRAYAPKPASAARVSRLIKQGKLVLDADCAVTFVGAYSCTLWFDVPEPVEPVINHLPQWSEDQYWDMLTDTSD